MAKPPFEAPLTTATAMERGCFGSFAEMKTTFQAVDKVGDLHVFDIGGNKYRLIAYVRYDWQRCYIKDVLTHVQYDEARWKR